MHIVHPQRVQADAAPVAIDLRAIIEHKNAELAKRIPTVAYRLLSRLLHTGELNRALAAFGELEGLEFVRAAHGFLDLDVRVEGGEHVATTARPVIAANHPLGGLDGIALMSVVGRHHPDLVVPVNDFLMSIRNLRPLFVPINKYGANWENFSRLADLFSSEKTIIHFPAGLCSRKTGHLVRDLEWKKTVVTRARATGRSIIPTYVGGSNSHRFYRVAQLRGRTPWRFNAEMILLVDEMFRARGTEMPIRFGGPIPPETFDSRFHDSQWAFLLRRYVYAMGSGCSATFTEYAQAAFARAQRVHR